MAPPDFNLKTIEALGKRAAYLCSNPDCRALTCGPTDEPTRTTTVGEAAHIFGAREASARFSPDMTVISRSEITNGIWLCKNCHKRVDDDPEGFPAELLFEWRRTHELHIVKQVGKPSEISREELLAKKLDEFRDESTLARQIIHDRPAGWEYRLTAEMLRNHLRAPIRRWRDLSNGLYSQPHILLDEQSSIPWLWKMFAEVTEMIQALEKLYSQELQKAWGEPGTPGNAYEIRHVCGLAGRAAERIVDWEETVRFVTAPETFKGVLACLAGCGGAQLEKLTTVPALLDEVVTWALNNPGVSRTIQHTIVFELPEGWSERIAKELEKFKNS